MANAADQNLTLSSAILAPLNSLFESQVHSARAFLSFVLQLGFKETISKEDLELERAKIASDRNLDAKSKKEAEDKMNRIQQIIDAKTTHKKLQGIPNPTAAQQTQLRDTENLLEELDSLEDVYTVSFNYIDGDGNRHTIVIPALALIPVQPLAIKSASFDFFMSVEESHQNYETKQKGRVVRNSPWEFISPRRLSGKIESQEAKTKKQGITVRVEVASAPIPAGLSGLLTSLTQSARITK